MGHHEGSLDLGITGAWPIPAPARGALRPRRDTSPPVCSPEWVFRGVGGLSQGCIPMARAHSPMPMVGDTHGSQLQSMVHQHCVGATCHSCGVLPVPCGRASSRSPRLEAVMLSCTYTVSHAPMHPSQHPPEPMSCHTVHPGYHAAGTGRATAACHGGAEPGAAPVVRCPLCPRVPAPRRGSASGARAYPHPLSALAPGTPPGAGSAAGDVRAAHTSGASTSRPC